MSHVATIELEINDLSALKRACSRIGLEFRENQTSYKWWGKSVGDYPLPEGFTAADLGHCEHALKVHGNDAAYEIGVVKRNGKYTLLWDFYAGGYGLEKVVGEKAGRLKQAYTIERTVSEARRQGYSVFETIDNETQKVTLKLQGV